MLSRFITNSSRHLRLFSVKPTFSSHFHTSPSISSTPLSRFPQFPFFPSSHLTSYPFSTNNNDNNNTNGQNPTSDFWDITPKDENFGDVFGKNDVGNDLKDQDPLWETEVGAEGDVFQLDKEVWTLGEEEKIEDVFNLESGGSVGQADGHVAEVGLEKETVNSEDDLQLLEEEEALMAVLDGPNRAFGDLVAASGITDAMLDSLIALKDFKNIEGLPSLTEIEDQRYENSLKKSSRFEMELQKQEEAAKARVRQVDEKGRAYGTGRRKCSIARVLIQPGEGKVFVNDKEFDVYFPMLDHRAALLRPFAETKTLGLWDVKCTVKGGGVSGQVGAIRLGISRALQNWEPGLRPPLREAGFLTRDPRVVERKKPGKAKARKSFQWVKR